MSIQRSLLVRVLLLLLLAFVAEVRAGDTLATTQPDDVPIHLIRFRAVLTSPGGELPFGLDLLEFADGHVEADIRNGAETVRIRDVTISNDRLRIDIAHYDASIDATIVETDGRRDSTRRHFAGRWRKRVDVGKWSQLPFEAVEDVPYRFRPGPRVEYELASSPSIEGRWTVRFEKSEDPAIGVFRRVDSGGIEGTFLTATGDYRYLSGDYEAGRLRLSSFDGAHAFLFDATLTDGGELKGEFWSRDVWHETWTGRRDDAMELPSGFQISKPQENADLSRVEYQTLDGQAMSLDGDAWRGRPRIIEVFGSWCPNCHDATALMNDLHSRYSERGLVVVGLAFEATGQKERDVRQVRRFIERNHVKYPVLIGGKRPREKTVEVFPLIDQIRAYPTAVFVDRRGKVVACYSGYSGPATGEAYLRLRAAFEEQVARLLDDERPKAASSSAKENESGA